MKFYTYNSEKTVLNLSFTCVTIYDRIFTVSSNFFDKETTQYMKFADKKKYKKNSGLFLPDRMYLSSSKIPSVKEIFRRLSGDKKGLTAISYSIGQKIDVFL